MSQWPAEILITTLDGRPVGGSESTPAHQTWDRATRSSVEVGIALCASAAPAGRRVVRLRCGERFIVVACFDGATIWATREQPGESDPLARLETAWRAWTVQGASAEPEAR
jgi:hypothetical protein